MGYEVKLSFIIPVYNVEKYVQNCINSITHQWNENCEIILVDDGSTDYSGDICEKNVGEHIKVVHKANGGLSSARNEGLKHAMGKYIGFVDSDDLIEDGGVTAILNWIDYNDADVCFMQAVKFYSDGVEEPLGDDILSADIDGLEPTEVIGFIASRQKYPGSACTKIYKRSFLERTQINFPHDRRQSEDLGFTMNCLLNAESFSVIDAPYYRYRQSREGSITNTASTKSVDGLLLFETESIDKLSVNGIPKDKKSKYAMSFVAYEYMVLLHNYASLSVEGRKLRKDEVDRIKWVLKYGTTKKAIMSRITMNLIGVDATSRILHWAYKRRLSNNISTKSGGGVFEQYPIKYRRSSEVSICLA